MYYFWQDTTQKSIYLLSKHYRVSVVFEALET